MSELASVSKSHISDPAKFGLAVTPEIFFYEPRFYWLVGLSSDWMRQVFTFNDYDFIFRNQQVSLQLNYQNTLKTISCVNL